MKTCITDERQCARRWQPATAARGYACWRKARDRDFHAFALWAAFGNRHVRIAVQRRGERVACVATRAIVALEGCRVALRARDCERAIDEFLTVVRPFAVIVRVAQHHGNAAVDVAADVKCSAATRARCNGFGKRSFRKLSHGR